MVQGIDYKEFGNDTLIERLDYDVNGKLAYMGMAKGGSSTADPVWWIKKLSYDVNGNLESRMLADGNPNFDNIWDNRTSLNYS